MFCFKAFFSFKTFLTKFSKQTLVVTFLFQCKLFPSCRGQTKQTSSVTLLFQCSFLLVVGGDNLVLQVYFFIGFFWHGVGSILKFSQASPYLWLVYTNISWDQTSKLYSWQVSCYMLIKYEEEPYIFLMSRGVPEYIHAKYYLIEH